MLHLLSPCELEVATYYILVRQGFILGHFLSISCSFRMTGGGELLKGYSTFFGNRLIP